MGEDNEISIPLSQLELVPDCNRIPSLENLSTALTEAPSGVVAESLYTFDIDTERITFLFTENLALMDQ